MANGEYKPNALDKILSVLPSVMQAMMANKLGQDRLAVEKDRVDIARTQALAQEEYNKKMLDMTAKRDYRAGKRWEDEMILKEMEMDSTDRAREIDREISSVREGNRLMMDLLKIEQDAQQSYTKDTMANQAMQEQIRSNAIKEALAKEELALAVRKQDEAFTKKDALEWEKRAYDRKVTDVPLLGELPLERIIVDQADDWFVDEQMMLDKWNNEGFQKKLAGEVGRFQKAKKGSAAYEDKLALIDRLIALRDSFDQPAFTEDKRWWEVWAEPGTSPEAKEGRRVVRQIDGLLSRLQ